MDGGRGSSSGVPSAVKIGLWHTDACGLTYIRNSSFEAVVHGQLHGIISMYKSTIFSGPEMTTDRIEEYRIYSGEIRKIRHCPNYSKYRFRKKNLVIMNYH